ncbi:nicotinate (nicotinamide) nucleotide adenylyltransferase [Campylobacter geochelonis]|uniref:nicotinate (nicotinamide) nucleotide adenylyltransferase n=1 Tax=Campylobacter geochelonis TaxID=1780362 RepID=UPI0007707805|nr:nicotinate (nicotinamide) nucleotide adenylyltransferase [Campylobacter geochelonis]CZE47053.1 putative nicotinate (nicotinamide) nucleotide adenylyltransferase [Campylobacter geochelonis]
MKIALYGGSFDPPHLGHDGVVKVVLANLVIDKLIIMPTFINPFKSDFCAPPELRLKWVKKIWQNLDKVEICDYEILQNRPVPSIESVLWLKKKYDIEKLYLIIGADHLSSLHLWDEFERLKNLVKFVVIARDGIKIPPNLQKIDLNVNISSTKIRNLISEDGILPQIRESVIKFYQGLKMEKRVKAITELLDTKKAENIEVIDMSEKEYMAKFVIIATTLTGRHALSLVDDLKEVLKPFKEKFLNIESSDEWSVIDLGDIIVHLMSETYREKYNIEEFLEKLKKEQI